MRKADKSGAAPSARRRVDVRALARAAALPVLSGVLYFLSWIGFGIWPLAFICLVPLLFSLRDATWKGALWRGALMGLVTHLGGYTWLIHLLRVFAFLPAPLAFLGYVLVCAFQGFLFGVFALVLRVAWLRTRWPLFVLTPLALCATEFVYPLLFQSYTGAALMPMLPLMQVADLGGALLTTALVAIACGGLADSLLGAPSRRRMAALIVTSFALGGAGGYGSVQIAANDKAEALAPRRRSALAQPNVGELALHEDARASVRTLWSESAEAYGRNAEVVVWPEAGFNAQIDVSRPQLAPYIQHGLPLSIIAGIERTSGKDRYNSAVMITKNGLFGNHFDKIQLLAFGEYIPLGDVFPIVYQWSPLASHLSRGTTTAPLIDGKWRYATFICYEDILPGLVRKTMEDKGQGRAHALVNLTNDSWYGTGHEQEQHLQLAAMRSIEHHRWMLRATSTGISAFIDSSGRVVQRIARDTAGVAVREVPMLEGETVYERFGDWPGWVSIGVLAIGMALSRRGAKV